LPKLSHKILKDYLYLAPPVNSTNSINEDDITDLSQFIGNIGGDISKQDIQNMTKVNLLSTIYPIRSRVEEKLVNLNLSLLDHLGSYSDGSKLAETGFIQPPKGSVESILQETTKQKPSLRIGEASVSRESNSTVEVRLTARYKPGDEEAYVTDRWGYTETKPLPALRITDLSEIQADLIEAFVPVAVSEAGGFAGFREKATKTNSLIDRLRKLKLPAVDEVQDGLKNYIETKELAEELEAKNKRLDSLINKIVYNLYRLTDEEIDIVESAVQDD
jgi:hypothetical protein